MTLRRLVALALASWLIGPATGEPAGVLRVCADPDNLPFSHEGAGEPGLYVELAELVAARLGARTEYTWWRTEFGKRAVRNTLLAERCDAFFGLPHEGDFMGPSVVATRPFLDVGWAIIAPAALAFSRLDDLKPRRLGVIFRSPPQLLLAGREGFATSTFRTDEEALEALARGELDAAFVWGPTAGYYNVRKLGGAYRVRPVAGEGMQWRAAVGVRRRDDALRRDLDSALAQLEGEIRALAARYGFPLAPAIDLAGAPATPSSEAAPSAVDAGRSTAVDAGRSTFNQHCAHCHSPDALSPEPSRDLRRLKARYGEARRLVFETAVVNGRPDRGMPRWSEVLDPAARQRVWAFLESVQLDR